ncbi:hypothetical protein [Reyranella sp.]|uniref:hypothetical protein n=1 Tax=Reyranella sp. TaxID=1929291 RepID=UPI0037839525
MRADSAPQLEGMDDGVPRIVAGGADYVRENAPDSECRDVMLKIGAAMAELCDISRMIYAEHPALNPYAEEYEIARKLRETAEPDKGKG